MMLGCILNICLSLYDIFSVCIVLLLKTQRLQLNTHISTGRKHNCYLCDTRNCVPRIPTFLCGQYPVLLPANPYGIPRLENFPQLPPNRHNASTRFPTPCQLYSDMFSWTIPPDASRHNASAACSHFVCLLC